MSKMKNIIKVTGCLLMILMIFTQCHTASQSTSVTEDTRVLNPMYSYPEIRFYSDESGTSVFTISSDTLCLYSLIPNFPHIIEYERMAICRMTHQEGDFYEINSIDIAWKKANRNVYVEYDTIGGPQPEVSVVLKFPNFDHFDGRLTVGLFDGIDYHRYVKEAESDTVEYKIKRRFIAYHHSWDIRPESYNKIDSWTEHFGIIGLDGSMDVFFPQIRDSNISERVNKITITYPNLREEAFSEYYLRGHFIKITPKSIFWNGDEYYAIDKKCLAGCSFITPNDTIKF